MKAKLSLPHQLKCFLKLSDAVLITDRDHIILDVNDSFQRITGYKRSNAIGQKAGFFKSSLTPQSTYDSLKLALSEEKPWSGIFYNWKDSYDLWHSSITITPIRVEENVYFIGVFRELDQLSQGVYISEYKRMDISRELLKVLAISCEIRDPNIEQHLLNVQELTERLLHAYCEKYNHHYDLIHKNNIIYASILHDIGKAGIPEGILYKPGQLTYYERNIMEMHPLIGKDMLQKISTGIHNEFMKNMLIAENIILYHHEKWDGTGYPFKLKEEAIPLEARIVAIVDVFDALTSRRAYKECWTEQEALSYIAKEKGKHFDPILVDVFLELFAS